MSEQPLTEAVVLIVFNRPEPTARVFEAIRSARPCQLFVIADGPRLGRPADADLCRKVREIVTKVDWECELVLRFSDVNLGCRKSVTEGLNWVFTQVERAIILEDDCLPIASFFLFCSELLERYAEELMIGMISGDNFIENKWLVSESYYFSRFCHIWGWATWRRAWEKLDPTLGDWPDRRKTPWLKSISGQGPQLHYWQCILDDSHAGNRGLNTWDVAWQYANWKNGMLCILPSTNLVKNVGFSEDSTHTGPNDHRASMQAAELTFPLNHPNEIACYKAADDWSERRLYYGATPGQLIFWSLRLPIPIHRVLQIRRMFSRYF